MSTSTSVADSATYDVVFVGAGHNALVAAAYLARAGRSVCLLDQGPVPGGSVRSEELTLPGFVHDTYSAMHPSYVFGPVHAELGPELAAHGLEYVQGEVGMAASLADGRSAVIGTDSAALVTELERLGEHEAWNGLMADLGPSLESLFPLLGMDLTTPEAAGLLERLRGAEASSALPFSTLLSASGYDLFTERFRSEELRAALMPWLLHVGLGPQEAGGALWAGLLPLFATMGNPAPVGGSGRLAEALTALVTANGGEIRTGVLVDEILTRDGRAGGVRTADGEQITARTAVIASTTPDQLYGRLLRDVASVPAGVRAQAKRYSYRRGCFQINLALSARPRFADSRLDAGGGLHLLRGVDELLTSVRQAGAGYLPEHPLIAWHEPTAVDPGRAPAGKAVVRIQLLDIPLRPIGDAAGQIAAEGEWTTSVAERLADRAIAEASEHVKGLADLVLARHLLTPADLARANPNTGSGDHGSGHNALSQAFTQRPIPAHRGGYATAVPGVYLIGAATWPGPSVSGSSGRAVALQLLAD
jgi:phytoene dehydrogenase-like protein